MILNKFFRLYAPTPDAGGTGIVDRGDTLETDLNPDDPDGALAAKAAADALKADPAVKDLEAELKEEDADEGEDKPKAKDTRIPLSRHKEILEKERESRAALERQLAQYQKGEQVADFNAELTAAETAVLKLEKEYATLLTDGEIDKATAVMAQIRAAERQMSEARSDMKIAAATARATESARYTTALERVEAAYPVLNPDHEDYDAATEAEVGELKSAYELKGLPPTAALQKAVKYVVGATSAKQESATSVTPNVSDKDIAAERKKDAVGKAAKAVAKTPPSLSQVGVDSDKLGGGKLSAEQAIKLGQKDFAALSDADLAQMRGDTL